MIDIEDVNLVVKGLNGLLNKTLAVMEVIIVVFIFVPLLILGIYRLFPAFVSWQTEVLGFPFPVFGHVVMIIISLLAIVTRRKTFKDYGLTIVKSKHQLDIAAACFVPVVIANIPFGLGVNHTSWGGALILAVLRIGLLFFLASILYKKPPAQGIGIVTIGLLLVLPASSIASVTVGKALALFLTYAFFVGFGEEIIYRGYMQSRLNEAFGKPYLFYGVAYGWGAILTSFLFGLTHIGIISWFIGISNEVTWAWGFWTFFSGLVFSFVREKSGGILAPALLHGLPQAIATVAILLIQ